MRLMPRSGRQLLLTPLLIFSLEKLTDYCEQSLPTIAHPSAHLVIKNLSWERGEGSSFSLPSGKQQTAILSLLSTVRTVYYLHQHFQPGFIKKKLCSPFYNLLA